MKRCDYCNGRFGLVRHTKFRRAFCSKGCQRNYAALKEQNAKRRREFYEWLTKPPRTT